MRKPDNESGGIKRRKVLRNLGVASGAAIIGTERSVTRVTAGGPPCFKDFKCTADADVYLKFELNEDTCEFELEKFEILGEDVKFDPEDEDDFVLKIAGEKPDEEEDCEPVIVEWRSINFVVTKITAFGGNSCDTVEDPEEGVESPFIFDTDLDAGASDQRAAISNIQFCLKERVPPEPLGEWQVDLIYGDPIFDFSAAGSYNEQGRLLQALDSCGKTDDTFDANPTEYAHCESEIVEDIKATEDGTATAVLDPGKCNGEEFALVSYETVDCAFDGGADQVLFAVDDEGTADEDGIYTFEVDVP